MTPTEGSEQTPVSHVVQSANGSQGTGRSWGGGGKEDEEMGEVEWKCTWWMPWPQVFTPGFFSRWEWSVFRELTTP